jgi:hypothetical protein
MAEVEGLHHHNINDYNTDEMDRGINVFDHYEANPSFDEEKSSDKED